MSLKSFHIFFIALSVLLSAGCAVWAFVSGAEKTFAIAALAVAIGLVIYGIRFLNKARTIIT